MKVAVFVLCFFLKNQVFAQILQFGTCPDVETVELFDIERFLGTWHEIERYPAWYEDSGSCAYKNIQACGNRIIQFQHVYVKNDIQFTMYVNSTYNPGDRAVFEFEPSNIDPIGIPLSVVATDYTNYAVIYGCRLHLANIRYTVAWILSRDVTLSPELLEVARDVLVTIPYASHVYLETVEQNSTYCEYYWTASIHSESTNE